MFFNGIPVKRRRTINEVGITGCRINLFQRVPRFPRAEKCHKNFDVFFRDRRGEISLVSTGFNVAFGVSQVVGNSP